MSDIVFILGAGASAECGAPVMSNFLDCASELLRQKKVDEHRQSFETVFGAIGQLQSVHSKADLDLQNIESIFTALEMAKVIQSLPGSTDALRDSQTAINALKTLIEITLERTVLFPVERNRLVAPAPYASFARLLRFVHRDAQPTRSVSVITFNYDIALDVALCQVGCGPDYLLAGTKKVFGAPIQLLKLHGSLNWCYCVSTQSEIQRKDVHPVDMEQYLSCLQTVFDGPLRIPMSTEREQFMKRTLPEAAVDTKAVIVPPSWNKADYHTNLTNVWSAAARNLSEASQIFVIGYSLPETDAFFRLLYALGSVGTQPLKRFEVCNIEAPEQGVDRRFQSLLGLGAKQRYRYRQESFSATTKRLADEFGLPEIKPQQEPTRVGVYAL